MSDLWAFIKDIDLFSSLDDSELRRLLDDAPKVHLRPGERLFEYGSTESSLFVILEGEIVIYRNQKTISHLGRGEYFGELALLESMPRSAAARASVASEAILLELHAEKCEALFDANPKLHASIARTLSARLRAMNDDMVAQYERVNMQVHDMRNMLCLFNYANIMLQGLPAEDPSREYLVAMINGSRQLGAVIGSILKSARGEASEPIREVTDLRALIIECVEGDVAAHDDIQRVSIDVEVEGALERGYVNPLDIKRVIANLLINAAQASRFGDLIHIHLKQEGPRARIAIRDHGHGIPKQHATRVFEPHFTSKEEGCGLGLSSCKEIVEGRYGGRLYFTSHGSQGTTFVCELPTMG